MTIANNLRRIMYEKGISQAELSKRTGFPQPTISFWMNGTRIPRMKNIDMLAENLGVNREEIVGKGVSHEESNVVKVRIYGEVAAGVPMEMIEDIYDEEEIPREMTRGGKEYFGLVIKGDSMEPRMKSGDIVLALKQDTAETGDTVIATINGFAATCKRFRRLHDGIELSSLNAAYEPMFFTDDEVLTKPVVILGKVVELRAKI